MKQTIFDLLEDDVPSGKEGYLEVANRAPSPKDDSFLSSVSDYARTFLKGTVEGFGRLGRIMGPIPGRKNTEQQLEEQTENLNELLPTEENYGQKVIRRGLKGAPTALAFPGGVNLQTGIRAAGAGGLGQTAEEFGAPEWAQTAAELTAFIGPDITKKILSSGKDKELIDFAKKMGMTDEQITPLIQSEFKQKWLSKLSPKKGSTEKSLKNTQKGIQKGYESVLNSEYATVEISEKANGQLINFLKDKLNSMPAESRKLIQQDLEDLLNNKITGKSLMNFWKDVGSNYKNAPQLGVLKNGVKEALESISPEMAKDFEMVNKLYSKYYPIASKLKPSIASDIISGAEALASTAALAGATMGNYAPLIGIIGEQAAKKFAQQLLINPHLQQLGEKLVLALNDNKFNVAKKLIDSISHKIRKGSPEVSKELEKISIDELKDLLSSKNHESE